MMSFPWHFHMCIFLFKHHCRDALNYLHWAIPQTYKLTEHLTGSDSRSLWKWPVLPLSGNMRCYLGRTSNSSHFFALFPSHFHSVQNCCIKQLFWHPFMNLLPMDLCDQCLTLNTLCLYNLLWQGVPENHSPQSKELLTGLTQSPNFI